MLTGPNVTPAVHSDINTLPDNHFRLITLGRLALLSPDGTSDESLGKRKRKLALLAMLGLSRAPFTRDALAEMFWGNTDEDRAKHSLSDALSHLRRVIGPRVVSTRQVYIELSPDAPLSIDAAELLRAAERKDYRTVVALYGGPFLNGVHIAESTTFEHWLERQRAVLRDAFLTACDEECGRLADASAWGECAALAERWLEEDLLSAEAAHWLLSALRAERTPDAYRRAHAAYTHLVARISREHDMEIDDRIARLAAVIAREADAAGVAIGDEPDVARAGDTHRIVGRRVRFPARPLAAAALILVIAAVAFLWTRRATTRDGSAPTVAVLGVANTRNDADIAWLEDGLPTMIGSNLMRIEGIEVIMPERVREVRRRAGLSERGALTDAQVVEIGRRLNATYAVTGAVTRGDSLYALELSMRDLRGRAPPRVFSMLHSNLLSLADAAVARIMSGIDPGTSTPRLAEVETSSLDAYQDYMRAVRASDEGRRADATAALDAAIARDSSFATAIRMRAEMSYQVGDMRTFEEMQSAFLRTGARASVFDRLTVEAQDALLSGAHGRAEQLAQDLVKRYPRDPRAYATLASTLSAHGKFSDSEAVLRRALSLDSLGMEAGHGPCAPCVGYAGLIGLYADQGELKNAEQAAVRWSQLQPDAPASWSALAAVLSYQGRYDEALTAARRADAIATDPDYKAVIARIQIMAGTFNDVIETIKAIEKDPTQANTALDLRVTMERERGRFDAAAALIRSADPSISDGGMQLVLGNTLARTGDFKAARALYERIGHPAIVSKPKGLVAGNARAFSWHHALLADAIAPVADTSWLRAVADSIQLISTRSYYGRDWRLHHHVNGLLAMRDRNWEQAAREFDAARWGVAGWTASEAHEAEALLQLGRPADAIRVLHDALGVAPDAMGRYTTRTEIQWILARAFAAGGQRDSAAYYTARVNAAWKDADPAVRALLRQLPR